MRDSCYIKFDRQGIVSAGMSKGPPALRAGQYAVRITLSVPDENLRQAIPEAVIEIPEAAIIEPVVEVSDE